MDEQIFITPKEAAGILRISVDFFYDLLSGRRGTNPPKVLKIGRHLRLPRAEFFRWADSQARKPPKRKR